MSATPDSVAVAEEAPKPVENAPKPLAKPPGKKLSDVQETKNAATGKASDVGRQLAFAGIAAVWILRNSESVRPLDGGLLFALVFLAAALLADLLQYVHCSIVWRNFYNKEYEKHNSDDANVDIPDSLSKSTYIFFWIKIPLLLIGFLFLIAAAIRKLQVL